jgi:type III secretion protein L
VADPYRLSELGHRLPSGAHVIKAAEVEPIAAATRLLVDAEAEAARIRDAARVAYQEEKIRGYEEGLEQARIAAVGRLLSETRTLDEALARSQGELTKLVVHAVRKLIDGFSDIERAEAVVRGALKQMRKEKRIQLYVSSAHHAHFRDRIAGIIASLPEIDLVDVIEDSALEPPRVIVESSIGRVDGHFAERLEELEALLRRAVVTAEEPETIGAGP